MTHIHSAPLQFSINCPPAKIKCTTKEDPKTGLIIFLLENNFLCPRTQPIIRHHEHKLLLAAAGKKVFNPQITHPLSPRTHFPFLAAAH